MIEVSPTDAPDYWAIRGWTNTLQKMSYDADICFLGNSITYASNFQTYFTDKKIVELGYPGDTMIGMMRRMDMLRAVCLEKVFLMAGINDLANQSMDMDEFAERYNVLVDSITNACPHAEVYLESILPVNRSHRMYRNCDRIIQANQIITRIAGEKGMIYIDLFSLYCIDGQLPDELTNDGIHLLPKAYDRWAEAIREYVTSSLK